MVRRVNCHATDDPPKIGPPGPSAAKYVAVDGPLRPSMAAMHRWSPLNYRLK